MSSLCRGRSVISALYIGFVALIIFFIKYHFNESFFGVTNKCGMTFMWRRVMLMDTGFKDYNHYSLSLYGEGNYAMYYLNTRQVDGIPIIFVPGNAGSGKQVRSLASVLQNKTESRNTPFHFDVFSVNFNEELSGVHSTYLKQHKNFLKNAIKHVWNMYSTPPKGIILYGHSLGGVVSQLVLNDKEIRDKIAMVFALASPFSEPPFAIDEEMILIWRKLHKMKTKVPIISIDGGLRDELIDPQWTHSPHVLHASSTEIDDVWLETDHQCIVWCNQLVRQNTRFLFDYARNTSNFAFNYLKLFKKHFKNSLQYVRLTKLNNDSTTFISPTECDPMCPHEGILKLDDKFRDTYVSITKRYSPLLTIQNRNTVVGEVFACSSDDICSVNFGATKDAVIELRNDTDIWILKGQEKPEELHLQPTKGFFSNELIEFSLNGFKMFKLDFDHELLVFNLQFKYDKPMQSVIYTTDKTKHLGSHIDDKEQTILVDLISSDDSNAQLYLFSRQQTNVKLNIELNTMSTFIKVIRFARQHLLPIIIAFQLLATVCGEALGAIFYIILAGILMREPVFDFTLIIFTVVMYLFLWSFNLLILPVFSWFNKKNSVIGLKCYAVIFSILLIFSFFAHSFPAIIIGALILMFEFPQCRFLAAWTQLFLITQIPSGVEFVFGVAKYQQIVYPTSVFKFPALLFLENCLLIIFLRSFKSQRPVFRVLGCLELIVVSSFATFKTVPALIALDSLSLFCVFCMMIEMNVLQSKMSLKKLYASNSKE